MCRPRRPAEVRMVDAITLIFCCQLLGELLVKALALPVPGPVAGMLILFGGLMVRGSIPAAVDSVADGLLSHLSLLFVPAGVGVMLHAGLLGREWLAISVALVASTLASIAVTGLVMRRLARTTDTTDDAP